MKPAKKDIESVLVAFSRFQIPPAGIPAIAIAIFLMSIIPLFVLDTLRRVLSCRTRDAHINDCVTGNRDSPAAGDPTDAS